MNIREYLGDELNVFRRYEILKETDEQITFKKDDDDKDIVIWSLDAETAEYMTSIDKISIIRCDKTQYLSDKSVLHYLEFKYKENIFICNFELFIEELHLSEYISIKMKKFYKEIDKNLEGGIEEDEVSILKELVLLFRKYITSRKEYRLRLLFKPLTIYNDFDWIVNA